MAPVATEPNSVLNGNGTVNLKALKNPGSIAHPFYSPGPEDDGDDNYEYKQYKVRSIQKTYLITSLLINTISFLFQPHWPKLDWEPLKEFEFVDRGSFVKSEDGFKNLLGAATKVTHLTPAICTELSGIDLRYLTDVQKDEL